MGDGVPTPEWNRRMSEREGVHLRLRILFGMALAVLGILFTFDNLGLLDAEDYLRFGWPVGLIAYGTLNLLGTQTRGGKMWGTIALVAGIALMGQRLGLWHAELRAFAPLLLALLGGYIVLHSIRSDGKRGAETSRGARPLSADWKVPLSADWKRPSSADWNWGHDVTSAPTVDSGESISAVAVLAGIQRRVTSSAFRGGELTAVLGGGQIDMREAIPEAGQAVLDVFVVMGGLEIRVPDSWVIEVRATPVLGAIRDTRPPASSTGPRLIVRGMVFLGGVEFKS
jgi:hypothetical protein